LHVSDIFINRMIDIILAVADAVKEIPKEVPKEVLVDYSTYTVYIASIVSSTITGLTTYMVGRRKTAKSEFTELVTANSKFRDEIKKELEMAKETIEKLQKSLEDNRTLIDEMQEAIADLKQQIVAKETKISDLQVELIKRDYQLQVLKGK
jgi:uncharacterized coiled-coil DUF342 family protein